MHCCHWSLMLIISNSVKCCLKYLNAVTLPGEVRDKTMIVKDKRYTATCNINPTFLAYFTQVKKYVCDITTLSCVLPSTFETDDQF